MLGGLDHFIEAARQATHVHNVWKNRAQRRLIRILFRPFPERGSRIEETKYNGFSR